MGCLRALGSDRPVCRLRRGARDGNHLYAEGDEMTPNGAITIFVVAFVIALILSFL